MALWTEQGCGLIVNGPKSLRLARRFEAAHDLFSSSCVSMRRFRPVVQPLVRAVLDAWAMPPDGDAIAAQLVHCPAVHCVAMSREGVTITRAMLHRRISFRRNRLAAWAFLRLWPGSPARRRSRRPPAKACASGLGLRLRPRRGAICRPGPDGRDGCWRRPAFRTVGTKRGRFRRRRSRLARPADPRHRAGSAQNDDTPRWRER